MTNLTDDELADRIRRGDPAAFDALHDRYHRVLARYAMGLLRNVHDAEDAVQDAFARALRHLRDDERTIELRPWLFAVVRNRCLDLLRARRDGPVSLDGLVETEPSGGLDPHAAAVQRDGVRAVVGGIGKLPERQRRALLLSVLEGRTHREIAERLGTSPDGSKSLVLRARARLASVRHALLAPVLKLGGGTAPVVALSAAAIAAPAVLTGGGDVLATQEYAGSDRAPVTGGYGATLTRDGRPLPEGVAFVEATVRLPAGEATPARRSLTLTCPVGFVAADSSRPSGAADSALGRVWIARSSVRRLGQGRELVLRFRPRPRLPEPHVATLGAQCMTPATYRRWDYGTAAECEAFRAYVGREHAAGRDAPRGIVRLIETNCG